MNTVKFYVASLAALICVGCTSGSDTSPVQDGSPSDNPSAIPNPDDFFEEPDASGDVPSAEVEEIVLTQVCDALGGTSPSEITTLDQLRDSGGFLNAVTAVSEDPATQVLLDRGDVTLLLPTDSSSAASTLNPADLVLPFQASTTDLAVIRSAVTVGGNELSFTDGVVLDAGGADVLCADLSLSNGTVVHVLSGVPDVTAFTPPNPEEFILASMGRFGDGCNSYGLALFDEIRELSTVDALTALGVTVADEPLNVDGLISIVADLGEPITDFQDVTIDGAFSHAQLGAEGSIRFLNGIQQQATFNEFSMEFQIGDKTAMCVSIATSDGVIHLVRSKA